MKDRMIGAWAMALYIYNTSAVEFVDDLFPALRFDDNYRNTVIERWLKSPTQAMGQLDSERIQELCGIVEERWGSIAETRFL